MPIDLAYTCRYCHSTQGTNFLATERMLGMGGEFTYTSCTSCGSIQLSSIPEDLGPYYPSDYYSFSSLQPSGFLRNLLKKIRIRAYFATGLNLFLPPFGGSWLKKLSPKFTDRIAAEADARLEEYEKQKQMAKEEFVTVEVYQVAIHQLGGSYDEIVVATREALAITIDNALTETEKRGGHVYVKKVKLNRKKIAT